MQEIKFRVLAFSSLSLAFSYLSCSVSLLICFILALIYYIRHSLCSLSCS